LDPASLLTAARTSSYWSSVCKGDPVLRTTVRRQVMAERERYQDEMLNPGLSITVQREGPGSVFQSNRRKIVQWREPTYLKHLMGSSEQKTRSGVLLDP
jgi:hypothetical protein